MRNLILTLLILPLFVSCSSDDDNTPKQDYTSFTIMQNAIENQPNTVVGYKLADGTYKKIADLGDLKKGVPSKEIILTDKSITEIYVFSDYISTRRTDIVFTLQQNKKNIFVIPDNTKGITITDKSDPTQYPQ